MRSMRSCDIACSRIRCFSSCTMIFYKSNYHWIAGEILTWRRCFLMFSANMRVHDQNPRLKRLTSKKPTNPPSPNPPGLEHFVGFNHGSIWFNYFKKCFFECFPIFQPQTHHLSLCSRPVLGRQVFRGRLLHDGDRFCGEGSEAMVNIVWRRHPTLGGSRTVVGGPFLGGVEQLSIPKKTIFKARNSLNIGF